MGSLQGESELLFHFVGLISRNWNFIKVGLPFSGLRLGRLGNLRYMCSTWHSLPIVLQNHCVLVFGGKQSPKMVEVLLNPQPKGSPAFEKHFALAAFLNTPSGLCPTDGRFPCKYQEVLVSQGVKVVQDLVLLMGSK